MKITKRQLRRIIKEAIDQQSYDLGHEDAMSGIEPQLPDPDYMMGYNDVLIDSDRPPAKPPWDGSGKPLNPDDLQHAHVGGKLQELGKGWQLSDRSCNTHNMPPDEVAEAMAILQEFGYELGIPITVDSNNIAIDDALAAYPGEFTYEDFKCAIQVTQGRGA